MIPGLELAPEYDRSMILKFVTSDSGSGSFQVDPLESVPVLESAPLVHCSSFLNLAEPVISHFDVKNEPWGQLTSNRWRARLCRKKNLENEPKGQLAIH